MYDGLNDRILVAPDRWPMEVDSLYAYSASNGWSQVCPNCSGTQRNDTALVYDRSMSVPLMINGYDGGTKLAGTWKLEGNRWTMVDTTLPPGRFGAGVAYDEARDVIVLYGGSNGSNLAETWEYLPVFQ
jgi:hypothetical protein